MEISRNGAPITVLDQHRGAFTLNGQSYKVCLSGTFARSYELPRGDEMLAFAKGVPFLNLNTFTYGDKLWLLKAENFRATFVRLRTTPTWTAIADFAECNFLDVGAV